MDKKNNDSLALIVGGLFVLALLFTTYNYFNKGQKNLQTVEQRIQDLQNMEKLDTLNSNNESNNNEQVLNDNNENTIPQVQQETINNEAVSDIRINEETLNNESLPVWVANDYKKGDISGNTYTVKKGDTLWEIAEAVYGDGHLWVNILKSNSSNIGFLPNGQQSLITAGQVLVID